MFEFLHHDLEQRAELQGISMADVLDLPEPLSTAIKRMVRGRSVLLSEFAADLGLSIDEARALGVVLAEKGLPNLRRTQAQRRRDLPRALRAGARSQSACGDLGDAGYIGYRPMTAIVSIHSFRRGAGKSTIAANIGAALAMAGARVGIVDANLPSPSMHVLFNLAESEMRYTFNDFLRHRCDIEQTAVDVTRRLSAGRSGHLYLSRHRASQLTRSSAQRATATMPICCTTDFGRSPSR